LARLVGTRGGRGGQRNKERRKIRNWVEGENKRKNSADT